MRPFYLPYFGMWQNANHDDKFRFSVFLFQVK